MEIIDFHTHPYINSEHNICRFKSSIHMSASECREYLEGIGISKICGSVVPTDDFKVQGFERIKARNDIMLALKELYGDFYVPGFVISPKYVRESLEEIERMHKLGINLIGELVPSADDWSDYSSKEFYELLDLINDYNMVVSFHPVGNDEMDKMVKDHKDIVFVGAHPGEREQYERHLARMRMSENYYLDLSGTGIFRHGTLRYGIDKFGAERFLFGSDFPVCNPSMYVGALLLDSLITDKEKEAILFKNAKRLLEGIR